MDRSHELLERGITGIKKSLRRLNEKGSITKEAADETLGRISSETTLDVSTSVCIWHGLGGEAQLCVGVVATEGGGSWRLQGKVLSVAEKNSSMAWQDSTSPAAACCIAPNTCAFVPSSVSATRPSIVGWQTSGAQHLLVLLLYHVHFRA